MTNPAPADDITLPAISSTVVNDACWKFINAMPHELPGGIFNGLKPAIYAALTHYHAAILADRAGHSRAAVPVPLLNFAVWDDGELRLLSGRTGPAFDCELYAMPDGQKAPELFAAPGSAAAAPAGPSELELLQAESAGHESAAFHLGALVDDLRALLTRSAEPSQPAPQAGAAAAKTHSLLRAYTDAVFDMEQAGNNTSHREALLEHQKARAALNAALWAAHPTEQPSQDAEALGKAVAAWIGGERTKHRGDTGAPEQWIDTSVARLGFAVKAVIAAQAQGGAA